MKQFHGLALVAVAVGTTLLTSAHTRASEVKVRADAATGQITVETDRYAARFDAGTLTYLHNKLRNRTMIDAAASPQLPQSLRTSLYVLQPDFYNRVAQAKDEAALRTLQPFWIYPANESSAARVSHAGANAITVTFKGLTSGSQAFPRSELTITVTVAEKSQDLLVSVSGKSDDTLVVGASAAYTGLMPRSINYTLASSGIRQVYDFTRDKPTKRQGVHQWSNLNHDWRCGLGGGLWPASVTVQADLDDPKATFGVWAEDDVPYAKYLIEKNRDNAYVTYANPPYRNNREAASVTWRINVYDKGWTAAAAPFANSIKRRGITENRAPWAQDISLILFGSSVRESYLKALNETFPPESRSKIVIWLPQSWRAMLNTKDWKTHDAYYWDNTFTDETVADFKAATEAGYRISVYTNPHFNWGHWKQVIDPKVGQIVKGFAQHRLTDPINERQMRHGGNNIAYTPYREHMLDTYRKIHKKLNVSIYLDTTHQWQHAPKPVDGLTNFDGARLLFQGTRAIKRDQFLGTENLNELAIMSGGCDYGLFFDLVWARGWEQYKARNTHPILSFLYRDVSLQVSQRVSPRHGPRYYHLAEEISERIGTIATGEWIAQNRAPAAATPEERHWIEKMRLYVMRGLRPFFPDDWEEGVMSYLRADDGKVFVYQETDYGSRFVERNANGKNRIIWARTWKNSTVKTDDGYIHDWIGRDDAGQWIGLHSVWPFDKTGRGYMLYVEPDDSRSHLRISALPQGVAIKRHSVTADIAEIDLTFLPDASTSGTMTLVSDQPILRATAPGNGKLTLESVNDTGPNEYRYNLSGDLNRRITLIWTDGVHAAHEAADDFRMPAPHKPGTKEILALMGTWDKKWTSDLSGPRNPRPGTIYSFEVTGRKVGSKHGNLTAFLTTPSTKGGTNFQTSGNLTFTEDQPQTHTAAGIRNTKMNNAWTRRFAARLYSGENVEVTHLSPVRFVRPLLRLSAPNAIDLGTASPNAASKPSAPIKITNTQAKIIEANGKTFATILYGAANVAPGKEEKRAWQQTNDDTGVLLVGSDAQHFELTGDHVAADGRSAKLVGADGEPGLVGGPSPESQRLTVTFKGAAKPGKYSVIVRIVTQAGNRGVLSKGEAGEPMAGLYYDDVPVTITVK